MYKSESLVLEKGIIHLNWSIANQEYKKIKSVLFWLGYAADLSWFWETATQGQGGIWGNLAKYRVAEFTWTTSGIG